MKSILLVLNLLFLTTIITNAQEKCIFKDIYKSKNEYLKTKLDNNWEFKNLVVLAKKQSFKNYLKIKSIYPEIDLSKLDSFIILDSYDVEQGNYVFKMIVNENVYINNNGEIIKSNINDSKNKIAKDLIDSVNNWDIILEKSEYTQLIDDVICFAVLIKKGKSDWETNQIIAFDNYN